MDINIDLFQDFLSTYTILLFALQFIIYLKYYIKLSILTIFSIPILVLFISFHMLIMEFLFFTIRNKDNLVDSIVSIVVILNDKELYYFFTFQII